MQTDKASRTDKFLTYFAALAVLSAVIAVGSGPILRARASAIVNYQVGDQFAKVAGLNFSQSAGTLVVFVNTTCGPCQDSADTLRRLALAPRSFQVAVIGYEETDLLRDFVAKFEIGADFVSTVPVDSIRFSGVPKIAMVDRRGMIRSTWSGLEQLRASLLDIRASAEAVAKDASVGRGQR